MRVASFQGLLVVVAFGCTPAPSAESGSAKAAGGETAAGHNTVARARIVELFRKLEQESRWDLSKDMLWGYFFTSPKRAALAQLRPRLEQQGYRFVEYLEPGDGDENRLFYLHVERIETHSVDSLHARNDQLAELAHDHGVTYDGMDVGPVGPAQGP